MLKKKKKKKRIYLLYFISDWFKFFLFFHYFIFDYLNVNSCINNVFLKNCSSKKYYANITRNKYKNFIYQCSIVLSWKT